MTHGFFTADENATPLDCTAALGLKLTHIRTQKELNEAENANILAARQWVFARRRNVLNVAFLNRLHVRMFGEVWKWAGSYSREYKRRIGSDAHRIEIDLFALVQETQDRVDLKSYSPDEIAIRFHHRLTCIHPYPNGNGRHARMAADLLAVRLGQRAFSWGARDLVKSGDARRLYIEALHAADQHDIVPLLRFARL